MKSILRIQLEEAFKMLGDPTRTKILRHLLINQATISQLGNLLNLHPAQIRYHILQLQKVGLVELSPDHSSRNHHEKYYSAKAGAFFLSMTVYPEISDSGQVVILGSDDPALNLLVDVCNKSFGKQVFFNYPIGSLDGLIFLRDGYCQIAGTHLYDQVSGEYNLPYVHLLFSNTKMIVLTLSHREQGLLVAKGNPKGITSIRDLIDRKLRYINRQNGAGTRLKLDQYLFGEGLNPTDLIGYKIEVQTHSEVGETILRGDADAGLGINAIATRFKLDFIPLFNERYDLVMPISVYESPQVSKLIEMIHSSDFKKGIEHIGGYDLSHSGEVMTV